MLFEKGRVCDLFCLKWFYSALKSLLTADSVLITHSTRSAGAVNRILIIKVQTEIKFFPGTSFPMMT